MTTRNPDNPEHGNGHDGHDGHTATEELLVRALAARAEQIGPHSLRPGNPPSPNWAARGRGPLMFALAAAVAGAALVGASVVTMLWEPDADPVAKTPPTVAPLTPSPPATAVTPGPATSAPPGPSGPANPSGPADPSGPSNTSTSRSVTVAYGPASSTFTLRTGEGVAAMTAKVENKSEDAAENVSEVLTIEADAGGGTLGAGDISVSLRDPATGAWRPVGGIGTAGYEATLAGSGGADLAGLSSRTHDIRVSLGSSFPAGITRLKIELFSDADEETLTLRG
ncbi:hypothetical protein ACIHCQ_22130 [Streptomyces sp. NPDC052236]|uniref:hypothetical protein n=1 Tax=Streptomyces sp. NPDC052236 TaxID=3365686 RepID=UPI0037D3AA14